MTPGRLVGAMVLLVAALQPLNAEFVLRTPSSATAALAFIVGTALLLVGNSGRLRAAGFVGLVAGAAMSPATLVLSPVVPLGARDLGRRRYVLSAALLVVVVAAGAADADLGRGVAELREFASAKVSDAVSVLPAPVFAAVFPWTAPVTGLEANPDPTPAVIVGCVALLSLILAVTRLRGVAQALAFLFGVATFGLLASSLVEVPRVGRGAPMAWSIVGFLGLAAQAALRRTRPRPVLGAAAALALFLLVPSFVRGRTLLGDHATDEKSWEAHLREYPGSRYRYEYGRFLLAAGDEAGWLRETTEWLDRPHEPTDRRRLHFALELLARGYEDAALGALKVIDGRIVPEDLADRRKLLDLYGRREAWSLYLSLAADVAPIDAEVAMNAARIAERAGDQETAARHLAAALAAPAPPLEAFTLAYQRASRAQDVAALRKLGAQAVELHPTDTVGYLALGRAAKLVRDDPEMERWYAEVLARNDQLPEVHYDLGLVYHGREDKAKDAAKHYRRVLELVPEHPRKRVIEEWIASLEKATPSEGGN